MFNKLLPKETCFFDFFEQLCVKIAEGAKELYRLTSEANDMEARIKRIKDIEHEADDITHHCVDALHKTFITPIDRNDIHLLINRMDDIMDGIDAAAARISMFEIKEIRPEAKGFADVLVRSSVELADAVKGLRNLKHAANIVAKCIQLHNLENEGDVLLRSGLRRLFSENTSPIEIIKWKEIFEILERATDRCEEVANLVEGILIEAS